MEDIMVYNLTNLTRVDSFYELSKAAADSTSGLFYGMILIVVFVVITMRLLHEGIDRAVAASSFICLMISILLVYLNFLDIMYPVILTVILAGTLMYIRFNNETG